MHSPQRTDKKLQGQIVSQLTSGLLEQAHRIEDVQPGIILTSASLIIQNTQNRDTLALQVKLSELVLALDRADNRVAAIEVASDEELKAANGEIKRRAAAK
ncbi:MAG: low affinity iron permease family protein [Pseudolabrys sp.]